MFLNITFISEKDRLRMIEVRDLLRGNVSVEERKKLTDELNEIQTRIVPLREMTLEQCLELKSTLWDKIQKLESIGKTSISQQYMKQLAVVEEQEKILIIRKSEEEINRANAKKENTKVDRSQTTNPKPKTGGSSWTVGIGNLD